MPEISLVRGDTLQLNIDCIRKQDGTLYTLTKTDRILIDVKSRETDTIAVIHKELSAADYTEDGHLPVIFYPADTENLAVKDYFFDVRLFQDEDNIYTIIPQSVLRIVRNITDIPESEGG